MRRSGKEKKFLKNLKKGDRVITKSGVHARINEFDEKNTTCVIDTMAGKLKIEKSAISLELSSNLNTCTLTPFVRLATIGSHSKGS